ncbi:MAG: hypothetical protein PHH08_00525 [Candidatus ainarchaeum sp.]|nr:hypothetical protein [Candidatus ainarchaeum sp.]
MPRKWVSPNKKAASRIKLRQHESVERWNKVGRNWKKNFDTASQTRQKLYFSDNVPYTLIVALDRLIDRNLELSPRTFNKKVMPLLEEALRKAEKRE